MDPRHRKRISIIQELYANYFTNNPLSQKTKNILSHQEFINSYINKFAVKFSVEKIARIDLAILQLAIYELLIEKKEPAKVIIDEAVELAHEFGGEKSYAFINAIMGKIYNEMSKLKAQKL